ncbi:uncharacterized protein FOBCDRAFT_268341 [Fusarium oxysporum Fo47]|uniref:uncharacterized protein n=1 Tax=Fusarium oxysporum Fo47 TaxID=660027 RepID=UPI002869CB1A|nr:uncharacterized protein FOBCDRAFT_268341 [Fusarium oxysporum Fo47]WJG34583.1 hypothetical protein FOBCDRAFT_268341 [Fusarium oxysporum Fo47]
MPASRAFDIPGPAPSVSRTTDLCSFVCPNNTSSRYLLDFLSLPVPPYLNAQAINGSLLFLQLESYIIDLCILELEFKVLDKII